jgi:hypothetical protein
MKKLNLLHEQNLEELTKGLLYVDPDLNALSSCTETIGIENRWTHNIVSPEINRNGMLGCAIPFFPYGIEQDELELMLQDLDPSDSILGECMPLVFEANGMLIASNRLALKLVKAGYLPTTHKRWHSISYNSIPVPKPYAE